MNVPSPVGTDLSSILPDLAEVSEWAQEAALSDDGADVATASAESPDNGRRAALDQYRRSVLDRGAEALRRLADDPEVTLTRSQQLGLEAIVLIRGRPALLVRDGDFPAELPPEWVSLEPHRQEIRASLSRVGRIEVTGHPELDWVGTGFLVADDVVMTNRHVAQEFARRDAAAWSFVGGISADLDLLEEYGTPDAMPFDVVDIVGVHEAEDVDLALLRVEPRTTDSSAALPSPLSLLAAPPDAVSGRPVYLIGYPAWDGRRNDPDAIKMIFSDVFDVKRLQPGRLTDLAAGGRSLGHDCSTLGGNSGSPVIDLTTHRVIGLHFGGRYRVGNQCVPLWTLRDDELVVAAGLDYGEGESGQPAAGIGAWPVVRRGARNHPVTAVQYLLRAQGHYIAVDGIYGAATEAAVRAFQGERRRATTGLVDEATWPRLVMTLHRGSRGDAVRALQSEFRYRRTGPADQALAVDGVFGDATHDVVTALQERIAAVDPAFRAEGTVDETTWRALTAGTFAT